MVEVKKQYPLKLINLFRIIRRDSLTLVTNMTGLSLGLAASILLTTFILFELSYDRHFSRAGHIYRLNSIWIEGGERQEMPINLRGAFTVIPERVAGIETAVQIYRGFNREVTRGENRHKEVGLLYTDPDFFRLFDLEILAGSGENALTDPNSVVLTEKTAGKIFGEEDPVGQSFLMDEQLYTVSAIVEEVPPNTHFEFDMLMPMESVPGLENLGGLEFFTYYLLEEKADFLEVTKNIAGENTRILTENFSDFGSFTFDSRLTPLTRLHLHSGVSWDLTTPGNMRTLYIMLVITIVVLGLALSNFINLYILNGARRSREIGLRKVNGADRYDMIRQFYLETSIVVTITFVAGAFLAIWLLRPFGQIMQRDSFAAVTGTPTLYLVLAALYLLTILVSGSYPALLLSRAAPISLIRETVNPAGEKRVLLRLVSVLQICIAVCLLSILLGINTQIRYMKTRSTGYDPEGIVLVYNLNQKLTSNYASLREQLLTIPGIEEVAASSHTIGGGVSGQGIMMHGDDPDNLKSIAEYRIRPGLCRLYRFDLISGRFLEPERLSDNRGVILNGKAVEMLGKTPEGIVGEQVVMHGEPLDVIGVVKDFHFETAAVEIQPLVLTAYSEAIRTISIRYNQGMDPQPLLRDIGDVFREFDPDYVMINRFAADISDGYYTGEERLQKILLFGSLFSLLIVMLGIYALVSHNLVSRTKEIGIRKVVGGSTRQMVTLIYKSTLKWSLLAAVLAVPLSWLYLDRWLNDFALRIPLYWWIFAGSICLVLLFQSLVTLGRTRSTARRNPVEALRYE